MPHSLRAVVRRLRQASAAASHGLSDAHLLGRFVRDRDEAAFEVLVWRHGPAVLGVCRRTLGNCADADDAFQAAFLTLVRKASTVRRGGALAAWLCRVAFRISVRLRSDRQRRSHAGLPEVEAPVVPIRDVGLRAALDDEIDRLPEAFRRVFVLCYLHGHTTAEAARALGCPRGTVLSRLAAARKRLRRRLAERGLAPAGLFATLGVAWPSGDLVAATVALVKTFAAGGVVPSHLTTLSQGVIRAMFLNKVKFAAGVALAVGMIGIGAGWLTRGRAVVAYSQPVAKADNKAQDDKTSEAERLRKAIARAEYLEKDPIGPEPGDDELRKLSKERFNAATREYALLNSRMEIDSLNPLLEPMVACTRRRAEVALELFTKPEDQVRILEGLFAQARLLEMRVDNRLRGGGIAGALPREHEKALGARLDIEIMLVKAKQRLKPAK